MNTIILKNQLDFQQYQLAVKALANMGIEVAEPEDSFEITEEDIRSIERAREDIKHGECTAMKRFLMKQEHIMKVFWTEEAKIEFKQTLMYWTIHNMSDSYSKKIDAETLKLVKGIATTPYFLANYVETIQNRQGYYIACIEEIAYRKKWIKETQLKQLASSMLKTEYGKY